MFFKKKFLLCFFIFSLNGFWGKEKIKTIFLWIIRQSFSQYIIRKNNYLKEFFEVLSPDEVIRKALKQDFQSIKNLSNSDQNLLNTLKKGLSGQALNPNEQKMISFCIV